ncbi:hypothetical protein [Marinobacter sp.]|uniref:hypothetical protein n=1 Tax=Marinobacter sp. TaxID=50741 RepID=UPI003A92EE5B
MNQALYQEAKGCRSVGKMLLRALLPSLLAEALADMVDINLGWSNLHETQERLCGIAAVLAEQFSLHCAPLSSALTATGTPTHLAVLSFQRA